MKDFLLLTTEGSSPEVGENVLLLQKLFYFIIVSICLEYFFIPKVTHKYIAVQILMYITGFINMNHPICYIYIKETKNDIKPSFCLTKKWTPKVFFLICLPKKMEHAHFTMKQHRSHWISVSLLHLPTLTIWQWCVAVYASNLKRDREWGLEFCKFILVKR